MLACLLVSAAPVGAAAPNPAPAPRRTADVRSALLSSIRFVTPSASDVLYGPTHIHVSVSPPPGTIVNEVVFSVDGEEIYEDRVPPFETVWKAGEKMDSHTIHAVASFSDGTSAEDSITTRELRLAEHEVVEGKPIDHVQLLVSVVDKKGIPIEGLGKKDFLVKDSGKVVTPDSVATLADRGKLPLSITVLVDRSGSMRFKMQAWREACVDLLGAIRPIDQVRVSAFAEDTYILQDFTHDAVSLAGSLERMGNAGGSTRLYRALLETMRDMRDLPGRKAIFLLTDGMDTELSGPADLANEKLALLLGSLERLASRAHVTLITVLPGPSPRGYLPVQKLSDETGGWWTYSSEDLGALLRKLGRELLGGYVISYDVQRRSSPDNRRSVRVRLAKGHEAGLEIHATLAEFGHVNLEDALLGDLKDGDQAQRARAAVELGRLGSKRAKDLLVDALGDDNSDVRRAAVSALAEEQDPNTLDEILKLTDDIDWKVREAAFDAAVRFGAAAIPGLEKVAGGEGVQRTGALHALGAIGDPAALHVLEDALADPSCDVRAAAVDGIGDVLTLTGGGLNLAKPGEVEASASPKKVLETALEGTCTGAADSAALALGRIADPAALPHLISMVQAGQDAPHRRDALVVLTSYLTPGDFKAIEKHLVSDAPISPQDRREAAALLAAAVRTTRWLGSQEGLARITDLGVDEARKVLEEMKGLDEAAQTGPAWSRHVEELLKQLKNPKPESAEDTGQAAPKK